MQYTKERPKPRIYTYLTCITGACTPHERFHSCASRSGRDALFPVMMLVSFVRICTKGGHAYSALRENARTRQLASNLLSQFCRFHSRERIEYDKLDKILFMTHSNFSSSHVEFELNQDHDPLVSGTGRRGALGGDGGLEKSERTEKK